MDTIGLWQVGETGPARLVLTMVARLVERVDLAVGRLLGAGEIG